ncbi:MAG: hypothetical protein ACI4Q6_05240 [Huintestinicola sp.]
MIKTEFGIIEDINERQSYEYEPDKYGCVFIDDEEYIDRWWERLMEMDTYFHTLDRPEKGLARWGITLIPPSSLPILYDIVTSDRCFGKDPQLTELGAVIWDALKRGKNIIHYGI